MIISDKIKKNIDWKKNREDLGIWDMQSRKCVKFRI